MREAHVRWCGFDPTTGIAWDDSWVRQSWLTPDLRAGGVIRRRRTAEQIREEERREQEAWDERHTHARKSRRLAGEDPEEENLMHDVVDGSGDGDDGDDVLHEQWYTSSRRCAVCPNPRGRVPGVERRAGLAVTKLQLQQDAVVCSARAV